MTQPELEMTKKEREAIEDDLEEVEYFARDMYFDRLLQLASDVCLRDPLPSLDIPDKLPLDRELVMRSGALALRTALEIDMKIEDYPAYEYASYSVPTLEEQIADHEAKKNIATYEPLRGLIYHKLDTPIKHPELFYDLTSDRIVRQVEQFGKAIIDEAFDVLGPDAMAYVEKMQSGDEEQQLNAIDWLANRINNLYRRGKAAETTADPRDVPADILDDDPYDKVYHMHPIHLSPKMMGVYPNVQLKPTCLMASILAASFFEKAGTEYMHAGVGIDSRAGQLREAADLLERLGTELGDQRGSDLQLISNSLLLRALQAKKESSKDNGYHAAVYAKVASGGWMQVDPYIGVTTPSPKFRDEKIEEVYQALTEFEPIAPHLELGLGNNNLILEAILRHAYMDKIVNEFEHDETVAALEILQNEDESVAQKIYDHVVVPYLEKIIATYPDKSIAPALNRLLGRAYDDDRHEEFQNLLHAAFYNVFDKYVLWGESIADVQDRMRRDQSYLIERTADITRMPKLLVASMALLNTDANVFYQYHHEVAELGLPHVRIGMSVLLDFATYCDDALSPSFWAAHWPSLIPITETMQREDQIKNHRETIRNLAVWTTHRDLTYVKSHKIIKEYLHAHDSESEDRDG